MAAGLVASGFALTLLPLREVMRIGRKRPVSQPFFMGSIDQWNKDVTIPITQDGEEIAQVSFNLNEDAIATTGGIAGVGYLTATTIFLSRLKAMSRAKIANMLVQKINLNVAIIQRIAAEGEAYHARALLSTTPIEQSIMMMSYQRYANDMAIAVDLMEDNIRHLKYANQIATKGLEGEPIAMFMTRTVDVERIENITKNIFDDNKLLRAGPEPIRTMAEKAFMTDAEVLIFQEVVESNAWFGSNPEARAVAAKFIQLDDVLGLAGYAEEAKGMQMLLNERIQLVHKLWNNLALFIYDRAALGGLNEDIAALAARERLMVDLGIMGVDDVPNILQTAANRIHIADTVAASQTLMEEALVMSNEIRHRGLAIELGVAEADRLAFAAGTSRSIAWVYRFAPRAAQGLALAGRFAGYVALVDLGIWVGTGLLIDLPLNLFMDEEDQGFFADRAGFTFIGEAIEWVILEGFKAIFGEEETETLYEAFLTMIATAIATDNYPDAATVILGWYVENVTVELMVPLSFQFHNTYEMPSMMVWFATADPLAILEVFLYAVVGKIVFTQWVMPTWAYMMTGLRPSL